MRSLLFVPGDRPDRMRKALATRADALILDLEDAVIVGRKAFARESVIQFLAEAPDDRPLFVRVNPLDGAAIDADLDALTGRAGLKLVLPKANGPRSVRDLEERLRSVEASAAAILPIATETPSAIFELGAYGAVASSLAGLTWGAEDLPAAIGATASRELDGRYTPPYEVVRALALFGAHAAGVPAIETVYPDFRDHAGLAAYAARGARDGFVGMMAIHPAQVEIINAAFSPSREAIARAEAIVAKFEANPGAGALEIDGVMIDAPHLKQARAVLARGRCLAGARLGQPEPSLSACAPEEAPRSPTASVSP